MYRQTLASELHPIRSSTCVHSVSVTITTTHIARPDINAIMVQIKNATSLTCLMRKQATPHVVSKSAELLAASITCSAVFSRFSFIGERRRRIDDVLQVAFEKNGKKQVLTGTCMPFHLLFWHHCDLYALRLD